MYPKPAAVSIGRRHRHKPKELVILDHNVAGVPIHCKIRTLSRSPNFHGCLKTYDVIITMPMTTSLKCNVRLGAMIKMVKPVTKSYRFGAVDIPPFKDIPLSQTWRLPARIFFVHVCALVADVLHALTGLNAEQLLDPHSKLAELEIPCDNDHVDYEIQTLT